MAATDSAEVTSPKVKAIDKWGSLGALGIAAIGFALQMVTPDLFGVLGAWAPIIAATLVFIGVGISRISAYQTADPLRVNFTAQQTAFELQRQREESGDWSATPEETVVRPEDKWPDNRG